MNMTQQSVLERIFKSYEDNLLTFEEFGKMLQELGVYILWNSPSSKQEEKVWSSTVNSLIKPFIGLKKIKRKY